MFSLEEKVENKGGEVIYWREGIGERVRNISNVVSLLRFRTQ